jgi:AcrR family transcriptional regulator
MDDNLILPDARPTRADAVKNRELLLRTAQRLFAEQGVASVSMSAVAQAAGVGKGTLYRHFPNKGELCQVLLDEDQRGLQERTLARLRSGGAPLDHLFWFLRECAAFIERNEDILIAGEVGGIDLAHPAHLWWQRTIRGLLQQVKPTIDVDYAADVLYLMLDVRTIRYQKAARHWTMTRILEGLIETARRLSA